jgi:hypothetical protein
MPGNPLSVWRIRLTVIYLFYRNLLGKKDRFLLAINQKVDRLRDHN